MVNYLVEIQYDGSNFYGLQKQKNKSKTIQEEIENKLSKIFDQEIKTIFASRTDKGVHAYSQFFNFYFDEKRFKTKKLIYILNRMLDKDIHVKNITIVNNKFHSRYDVKKKTYIYKINKGTYSPFLNKYTYFLKQEISIEKLKKALYLFKGKHDFYSFCGSEGNIENYTREISKITLKETKDLILIEIRGSGFLRYMIRMIIGSSLQVAKGNKNINYIKEKLNKRSEKSTYKIDSSGLYLKSIEYKKGALIND